MLWVLALSYWIHLLATAVWFGGLALMFIAAWPAMRRGVLAENQWFDLQRRFLPWANISLLLLLLTGLLQMTNDVNYSGFLRIDSVWAGALLLKHIAFFGIVLITVYMQGVLYPTMKRLELLSVARSDEAQAGHDQLRKREGRLLWINLVCATAVLLFTAVATAV